MTDLLDLLSPSRLRVVDFIKRRGDVTVEETVDAVGLAETTIRQHFSRLVDQGILEHHSVPDGPGRPTLRYSLTAKGERLFPTQDARLFGEMLGFLVREGYPGLVDTFFRQSWAARGDELAAALEEAGASTLTERLAVVEAFLVRQGFFPEIVIDDEEITIRECNCPFAEGVRATRLPCRLEAQLLEQALQRDLTRVAYIPDGHPACVYAFRASAPEDATADGEEGGDSGS